MDLRCPRCKAKIEPGDTFCGECGCPLKDLENMGMPGYDDLPEEGGRKEKHTALIIILVVLIVAVLAAFGGLFLFNYLEDRKGQEVAEELREELEESEEETDGKAETEESETGGDSGKAEEPEKDPTTDNTSGDYIFPDSASRYLTDADVAGMTIQEINYGKNEIYARHGRRFKSQELMDYFGSKSWYQGLYDPDDFDANYAGSLNDYEKWNAEFLSEKEHELDSQGYIEDAD